MLTVTSDGIRGLELGGKWERAYVGLERKRRWGKSPYIIIVKVNNKIKIKS